MAATRRNPTYYDGDLRSDLLEAALVVIGERGPESVSLRDLAKRLGVSHAAPANHFRTKQELFSAIARQGFERLGAALGSAQSTAGDEPVDVLHRLGIAYLDFAAGSPGHFAVMFRADLIDGDLVSDAGTAAFAVLERAVAEAQRRGWRSDEETRSLAMTLWSVVHGYAHLRIEGPRLVRERDDRDVVVRLVLHDG